jgi:hypothetical protein
MGNQKLLADKNRSRPFSFSSCVETKFIKFAGHDQCQMITKRAHIIIIIIIAQANEVLFHFSLSGLPLC